VAWGIANGAAGGHCRCYQAAPALRTARSGDTARSTDVANEPSKPARQRHLVRPKS